VSPNNELGKSLVELRINEGESFEGFLRRFTKRVQQESIISEARRRQHFEPPSITRKKTAAAKKRKSVKATLKNM
jgi:small subunit ribosomal protein S21